MLLFPVGPFCHPRYVDEILPRARDLGVGTVCFKTFGAGKLLGDTEGYGRPLARARRGKLSSGGRAARHGDGGERPRLARRLGVEECLRYTLTCDPDVALLGLSFPNEQDAAFAAAAAFRPMRTAELAGIRVRAAAAMEGKGAVWWNPAEPPAGRAP